MKSLGSIRRSFAPWADPAVDIFFRILPGDRAHMTARPLDRRQFTADMIDANQRAGLGAAIGDLILFGRHWGFELRNIDVPIIFYGGSSDIIVPYLHAERQSKRVPGSRLRTYEGRGHFAGYTTWSSYVGFNGVRFGDRGKHFKPRPGLTSWSAIPLSAAVVLSSIIRLKSSRRRFRALSPAGFT